MGPVGDPGARLVPVAHRHRPRHRLRGHRRRDLRAGSARAAPDRPVRVAMGVSRPGGPRRRLGDPRRRAPLARSTGARPHGAGPGRPPRRMSTARRTGRSPRRSGAGASGPSRACS
jgi:hypothetical protein